MQNLKTKSRLADAACLLVAVIWGSGFIASQLAIDAGLGSSVIMALRFGIAAVLLLLICVKKLKTIKKKDVLHGAIAGVFLFCAFYLQIYGQARTTVSNSAFLTATNVVMVPFIVWLATRKPPAAKTFVLAGTTLVGIALLTLNFGAGIRFSIGDGITLLCALFFALHIFYLGKAVAGRDALVITFIQISTAAVLSIIVLFVFDRGALAQGDWGKGIPAALYLGLFSTLLCYLLQTWAQKYASPTKTGILLSTEGLFGTLFSVLMGFEKATVPMVVGGLVIFASVVLMELPIKPHGKKAGADEPKLEDTDQEKAATPE